MVGCNQASIYRTSKVTLVQLPGQDEGHDQGRALIFTKFSMVYARSGRAKEAEMLCQASRAYLHPKYAASRPSLTRLPRRYWNRNYVARTNTQRTPNSRIIQKAGIGVRFTPGSGNAALSLSDWVKSSIVRFVAQCVT
jgi:hypothetical protein